MILLGIDPGTRRTGWGVVRRDGNRLARIDSGTIRLDAQAPLEERLVVLFDALQSILTQTGPDEAAVEDVFFAKNANSALKLGHARGVLLLALRQRGIPVCSYPPAQVKRALIGGGRANKHQINQVVRSILGVRAALEEDEADALAIAICHANAAALRARLHP